MDKERRQRPNKREAILHYAMKVFAYNGYGATTHDMIAEQAGVTRSLIIKYYGAKENLAAQAIGTFVEDYSHRLAQAAAKETSYADFVEKTAKLVKRWRTEAGFIAALSATPAQAHLAADVLGAMNWVPERYETNISPQIIRQMAALHIAYAVDGDEAAYDTGRDFLLCLVKDA